MGVVGDPSRTSTVVSEQPFMGLVAEDTSSWKEPEYNNAHVNTCWELVRRSQHLWTLAPCDS